jgi:hypothetical protein
MLQHFDTFTRHVWHRLASFKWEAGWLILFGGLALMLPPPSAAIPIVPPAEVGAPKVTENSNDYRPSDTNNKFAAPTDSRSTYVAFDFLKDYLTNETTPIIRDAIPWDFSSTNMYELHQPVGGNSYWDYWNENENWDSPSHLWRDDQGNWHPYKSETIKDAKGNNATAYVLFEKDGPGVMDNLGFTHDCVSSFLNVLGTANPLEQIFRLDVPDQVEWGNLSKLGNLRIEVDGQNIFDGPIENWFSGDAQHLTPTLKDIFTWRYRQFGSVGSIVPIPYQKHIKLSVYGGNGKPVCWNSEIPRWR